MRVWQRAPFLDLHHSARIGIPSRNYFLLPKLDAKNRRSIARGQVVTVAEDTLVHYFLFHSGLVVAAPVAELHTNLMWTYCHHPDFPLHRMH